MADQRDGGIAWTDAIWNPVSGCSRVSEGCRNCYAEKVAARFSDPGQPYAGLATRGPARWTGEVRLAFTALSLPLRWTKPRRVFVNSMSDLFHEKLTDEEIAAVFGVMAAAPRHVFQILTKRPERMRRWFEWLQKKIEQSRNVFSEDPDGWIARHLVTSRARHFGAPGEVQASGEEWPLPNVWLGVSVEDQRTADERIPLLLQTPAAVRFVSYEPALGPADFERWLLAEVGTVECEACGRQQADMGRGVACEECGGATHPLAPERPQLDWVIIGGESGPDARPSDLAWASSTVAACKAAGVPVFVKQLGAQPRGECDWHHHDSHPPEWLDEDGTLPDVSGRPAHDLCHSSGDWWGPCKPTLRGRDGGDILSWPEGLRVREFPGGER